MLNWKFSFELLTYYSLRHAVAPVYGEEEAAAAITHVNLGGIQLSATR